MIKHFVKAARLRTLPLSVSGIILGSFLAAASNSFDWLIFVLAILTTIGLQVLSNFANDYGDGVKGTDNDDRIGPERALQSGVISPRKMLNAIILTSVITFVIALALIYVSFGADNFVYSLLFIVLGVASIVAAIKYTMGENAYGYSGFGDVFVFLFFGILSVCGSNFLYTKVVDLTLLLPAASIGLLSAGVLNLNNMRDRISDEKSGKNTLVVKIGGVSAKYYHYALLTLSFIFAFVYVLISYSNIIQFLFIISYIPVVKHVFVVVKANDPADFDPELKKLALSTLTFSLLYGIIQIM